MKEDKHIMAYLFKSNNKSKTFWRCVKASTLAEAIEKTKIPGENKHWALARPEKKSS